MKENRMEKDVKARFDQALEDVKDPESALPLSRLGVVKRFRFDEEGKNIYVFTNFASHRPGCLTCAGITMVIEKSISRDLKAALQGSFPGFSIEILPEQPC
jgi:metal-sulfur cluster biosynthetic enzyme